METLTERFDALQEKLLNLFEQGSKDIASQILYWNLMRQESVLMHYARRQGLRSIGYQTLPSLQASEHKAKEAIMMGLYLTSLQKSPFGAEPWNLSDTSLELFQSAPPYTFKKGSTIVEVIYDGDPQNSYPYTLWTRIYYQDTEDQWHRADGQVDYTGLYYVDAEGHKNYFVRFVQDAARYSSTGTYEVRHKNRVLSIGSSDSVDRPRPVPDPSPVPVPVPEPVGQEERAGTHSKTDHRARGPYARRSSPRPQRKVPPRQSGGSVEGDGSEGAADTGGGRNSEEDSENQPAKRPRAATTTTRGRGRGRGSTNATVRARGRGRGRLAAVPTPEQVGTRHRAVEGQHKSRLRQLQEEAWDPPIIIVKGDPNSLKCWRYRCNTKHRDRFQNISTTFHWVGAGGERLGRGRLLVTFGDDRQREDFLETVPMPRGTDYSHGAILSL
nr:MAG: E2 protein [Varecia rubra papillomavirus 1]